MPWGLIVFALMKDQIFTSSTCLSKLGTGLQETIVSNDQLTERVESDFMVVYQDQRAHLNRKLWFRLKGFFCKVFTNLGRILETLYIMGFFA